MAGRVREMCGIEVHDVKFTHTHKNEHKKVFLKEVPGTRILGRSWVVTYPRSCPSIPTS